MTNYSNLTILVVDDSSTMRALIRGMLQHLGVRTITEAANGQAALDKIAQTTFDVIISDWHMAPMDGLSLLRHVQQIRRPSHQRFIFVTVDSSLENKKAAEIEGADAVIAKPFKLKTLEAAIELAQA